MTEQNFIKACEDRGISAKLTQNTIDQFGDWESFEESAFDVANNGINGRFHGFIYYAATTKFFQDNRDDIMAYAEQMADDLGEDTFGMFLSFNCMKDSDINATEIAKAIYANKGEMVEHIQNCLAWFAGEEVCRVYADLKYEDDEE